MTASELKEHLDKEVLHVDRRHRERALYILRGVKRDELTGRPYAILQDRNVRRSYVRARVEDIEGVGENVYI